MTRAKGPTYHVFNAVHRNPDGTLMMAHLNDANAIFEYGGENEYSCIYTVSVAPWQPHRERKLADTMDRDDAAAARYPAVVSCCSSMFVFFFWKLTRACNIG